jgi:septal ring factor EnvC (AmiA/AmiB activator)
MKTLILPLIIMAASTPAHAFCSQGFGVDFAQKVSGYIDYLICLHNEQTDSLNEHARLINQHANVIGEIQESQRRQWSALQDLSSIINVLSEENQRISSQNQDLERQIEELTVQLRRLEFRVDQLE